MGNAVPGTQLMGDGMNITHTHLINGDSSMISRQRHTQSRLGVFGFCYRSLQPLENTLHAKAGILSARTSIPHANVSFDRLERTILDIAPDAVIHGGDAPRLANTLFFTIPGLKAETMQIAFDLAGLAVSAGSACSSGKVGRSHVLTAMGITSEEGAIRVSFGRETGEEAVAKFAEAFHKIVSRARPENRLERA